MTVKAILFGSIGTLVETSDLQRLAFNQAFAEAGLDWNWTIDIYRHLLTTSGGRGRIEKYAVLYGIDVDAQTLHRRKTEIFDADMANGHMPLRAGVKDVIHYARQNAIRLAFVTSTSQANVNAVFSALGDQISDGDFAFTGNDTMVTKPKPSPDIYLKALADLDLYAHTCVAVEDTQTSLQSALGAGLKCIAFPGAYAAAQDFSDALLTTDALSPDHFKDPEN